MQIEDIEPRSAVYALAIAAITLAAAMLRIWRLDDPMRYDEAFTFLAFAAPDDPSAWLSYYAPNNHVLHTLAMRLVISMGGQTPPLIRIPALVAGVALAPLCAWLAVLLSGRRLAGICAAGLIGASSLLIEYSANARGYSMVCLAAVAMGIASVAICRAPKGRWCWLAWALTAALGTFVIPVMLYAAVIFALIIALQIVIGPAERKIRRLATQRLIVTAIVAAALTAILYLPVIQISGWDALVANEYVTPKPFAAVWTGLGAAIRESLAHWTRDTSLLWRVLVGVGLVGATVQAIRRRNVSLAVAVIGPVVVIAAALGQRVIPFARVWLFLLPLILVCASCGLVQLAERFAPKRAKWAPVAVLALTMSAALGLAVYSAAGREFLISEDPRTLVDAEAICRDLSEFDDGRTALASQVPAWPSLKYYSLFHCPTIRIPYIQPRWRRVFVVVGDRQEFSEVVRINAGLAERYQPLQLWRQYPHAKVYLTRLRIGPPRPFDATGEGFR